jgi:subtilisin-like proprotein convertase family protein
MTHRSWIVCALALTLSAPVHAAVPLQLPAQGVLRDNAGIPVLQGTFEMTFALYDSDDAEAPVWTETWPEVQVTGGTFRAMLGAETPLDSSIFAADGGLWLGVSVEGEPELPRRPLGSTPFARHAGAADHLACTGCVAPDMLSEATRASLSADAVEAVEAAGFAKADDVLVTEDDLPPDGLDNVSNGLMTNEFTHTFASAGPVDIEDDYPPGVLSEITVGDVGTVKRLRVNVEITNSNIATVTVTLFDPSGFEHTLWAESGPGTGLKATYPAPDAQIAGDLNSWVGQDAQGAWILKVIDDGFLNNDLDGAIDSWSIEVDTVSNQTVQVDGDLIVNGAISGPSGIVVGPGTAPCDAAHAGAIQFDPASKRLTFCTGDELLQLKACSTTCPAADEVTCGLPIQTGCDGPCGGTGTALDPVQCLSKVGTTPCQQPVLDGCDNDCGSTGTALDFASCPAPEDIPCGSPVLDTCGNICGANGTLCSNAGVCLVGECVGLGQTAESPGLSCKDILDKDASIGDGGYWIDPDGPGLVTPVLLFCDMTTEGGGWIRIDYAEDLPFDDRFGHIGQDALRWLPEDLATSLPAETIAAIRVTTTEGRQSYVGLCEGVIHYFEGGGYTHALGFRLHDGTETPQGQASYAPFDITVTQDGCSSNGGEGGQVSNATIFVIRDPNVPVINVQTNDTGQNNESFGSPLFDNPAWLR